MTIIIDLLVLAACLGLGWLFVMGLGIIAGADADNRIRRMAGKEEGR